MRPPSVVRRLVLGHHDAQVAFAKISSRSVSSVRVVSTNRSAEAFVRGLRGGIFTGWMPVLVRTASKQSVNCRAAVGDQELEVRGAIT
jgi:hypothetical protein